MSDDALPAGSWTHSLRRLAVEYDVAEASVPQLTQASHLSHLSLLNLPEKGASPELVRRWVAFWDFAASHPPLRTLSFRDPDDYDAYVVTLVMNLLGPCMRLAAKRPRLQVSVVNGSFDWPLDELRAMPPADEG